MALYYFTVERGVYGLLTAINSDSVTNAEARYKAGSLVLDTDLTNSMYPPVQVRSTILQMERVIASAICRTEGHPRRSAFRRVVDVSHMDQIPSSVGGIGSVYDPAGGDYLTRREPDIVSRLRGSHSALVSLPTYSREDYWAWDGTVFFTTLSGVAKVEVFDPQFTPVSDFAVYDTQFSVGSGFPTKLPEEYELPWALGAAGVLASKVGSFPEEASGYLGLAQQLLEQSGIKIKVALDYNANEG
jgi:hypothetical protein